MVGDADDERLRRIKQAAKIGQVILTNHARERMSQRGASAKDVEHAIATATTATPQEDGKFRLAGGTDVDGDALITVVVEIQQGLRLITVM